MGRMLKKIKQIPTNERLSDCTFVVYGPSKAGKTNAVYQIVMEEHGTPEGLVFLATEEGHVALPGAFHVAIESWQDMMDFLQEVAEDLQSGVKLPFHSVCIDTADIMAQLVEEFILTQFALPQGPTTMNNVLGGWGEGGKQQGIMMGKLFATLKKFGFSVWIITHDSDTEVTDNAGNVYRQIDNSLPKKTRLATNAFADFIVYIDTIREYESISVQKGKKIETQKHVKEGSEKRIFRFRGDSRVKCGSRFPHIEDYVDYDAKKFVEAVRGALDHTNSKVTISSDLSAQKMDDINDAIKSLGDIIPVQDEATKAAIMAKGGFEGDTAIDFLKAVMAEHKDRKKEIVAALKEAGHDVKSLDDSRLDEIKGIVGSVLV
jgi:hypothetical protein